MDSCIRKRRGKWGRDGGGEEGEEDGEKEREKEEEEGEEEGEEKGKGREGKCGTSGYKKKIMQQ